MIERNLVAEEERLVRGHRFDHVRDQGVGAVLHFLDQLGNSAEPGPAGKRNEPAFNQILLVGGEVETGTLSQELTQILIVQ